MEKKFKIVFIFLFCAIYALPVFSRAATLSFAPLTGTFASGKTLTVNTYVSSADQSLNAASGIILFPQDKLEVMSLSKAGSIFTLWVQEPSFSNSAGTINFEGVVPNPGFSGNGGKILSITFKVKSAGEAYLAYSSGSVLANDGMGTNILTGTGKADFKLSPPAVVIPKPEIEVFSVSLKEVARADATDPNVRFIIDVKNNKYDVDHFEIKIDNGVSSIWKDDGSHRYEIISVAPGSHVFAVAAVDKKGNVATASADFIVSKIGAPIVTEYPEKIEVGTVASIKGKSVKNSTLILTMEENGNSVLKQEVQSDDSGNFVFVLNKNLNVGVYSFVIYAIDYRGVISDRTSPFMINVNPKLTESILAPIMNYLSLIIIIVLALGSIAGIIIFVWYKLRLTVRRMRRKNKEAEKLLENSFNALHKSVRSHVTRLKTARKDRVLTEEEVLFLEQFENSLTQTEGYLKREIKASSARK